MAEQSALTKPRANSNTLPTPPAPFSNECEKTIAVVDCIQAVWYGIMFFWSKGLAITSILKGRNGEIDEWRSLITSIYHPRKAYRFRAVFSEMDVRNAEEMKDNR